MLTRGNKVTACSLLHVVVLNLESLNICVYSFAESVDIVTGSLKQSLCSNIYFFQVSRRQKAVRCGVILLQGVSFTVSTSTASL